MKKTFIASSFALILCTGLAKAQAGEQAPPPSFTIQEAVKYALANNMNHRNVLLDEQLAVFKKNEVRGMGLPQVSSNFDLKDFEKLPTQLIPGEFFGGAPGTYIPVQFGTQYNATATIQASQIIFNSDYIVALQTSKSFLELSQKNAVRSGIETAEAVSKAYYNVLVSRERAKLLDAQISRVKQLLDDTKTLNQNGFVEKLDVDRITLTYNNLLTEKEKVGRLIGLGESLLKFQMGFNLQESLFLSDSLDLSNLPDTELPLTSKFEYGNRIEYSLLQTQLKLNELDLKRWRMHYWPSLVMYGSLSSQAQRNEFDFFDSRRKWYPTGLVGMTISVPVFNGLQTHYRIQQSRLSLMKTMNTVRYMEQVIDLERASASVNYQNALASLKTQQGNMKLADEIFSVSKKKYDQGVGSVLEVTNAETSLKESQAGYYNALYEYYIAKIEYDKSNGTLK